MAQERRPTEAPPDQERAGIERPDTEQQHEDPAAFGAEDAKRRGRGNIRTDVAESDDEREERDVERSEDRCHPRLETVAWVSLGEGRDRDEDDSDCPEKETAAL